MSDYRRASSSARRLISGRTMHKHLDEIVNSRGYSCGSRGN